MMTSMGVLSLTQVLRLDGHRNPPAYATQTARLASDSHLSATQPTSPCCADRGSGADADRINAGTSLADATEAVGLAADERTLAAGTAADLVAVQVCADPLSLHCHAFGIAMHCLYHQLALYLFMIQLYRSQYAELL